MIYDMIFPISKKVYTYAMVVRPDGMGIHVVEGVIVGYISGLVRTNDTGPRDEITFVKIRVLGGKFILKKLGDIADNFEDAVEIVKRKNFPSISPLFEECTNVEVMCMEDIYE